jgi:MFS family permease
MVVLDIASVKVTLPSIQHDLGIGQSTLQWIVIGYGLVLGGFLLLGGRMATPERFGPDRTMPASARSPPSWP